MRVSQEVLAVLDRATVSGSMLILVGQLDRKLYTETMKVIEAAGGKWNRKAGAHVFEGDAAEAIEPIILTGEYSRTKQDFGQFYTPEPLAHRVAGLAAIEPGMTILEPSAGRGSLAVAAADCHGVVQCVEIDKANYVALQAHIDTARIPMVRLADFLTLSPEPIFDRVVMNPPFAKQADIDHVLHAAKFLKPGGRLVSIMSASVSFRENAKTKAFRSFVDANGGTIASLPTGSFKASGTDVNSCVVSLLAA